MCLWIDFEFSIILSYIYILKNMYSRTECRTSFEPDRKIRIWIELNCCWTRIWTRTMWHRCSLLGQRRASLEQPILSSRLGILSPGSSQACHWGKPRRTPSTIVLLLQLLNKMAQLVDISGVFMGVHWMFWNFVLHVLFCFAYHCLS